MCETDGYRRLCKFRLCPLLVVASIFVFACAVAAEEENSNEVRSCKEACRKRFPSLTKKWVNLHHACD